MSFQVSPGINVSEIDLSTTVPTVSTTEGAIAGVFGWGPVDKIILVDSENSLVQKFGKPTSDNYETWFSASNFLAYGNKLYVSRAANTSTVISAVANTSLANAASHTIKNRDDYDSKSSSFSANVQYIAKYPGDLGNSLKVSVCDNSNQYHTNIDLTSILSNTSFGASNTKITIEVNSNTATVTLANSSALSGDTPLPHANNVASLFSVGDYLVVGNNTIGRQSIKITSVGSVLVSNTAGTNTGSAVFTISLEQPLKLSSNVENQTFDRYWEYYNQVDIAPGQSTYVQNYGNTSANDELHVVVIDEDGKFSGNPGTVLEVYQGLSRATDAKTEDGATNYYKNVINDRSNYVWAASDRSTATSANALNVADSSSSIPLTLSFVGGDNGSSESSVAFADLARAYDLFAASDVVDISLIITGKSRGGSYGEQLGNYLIDNIAEVRKDCVVFISPDKNDVVNASEYDIASNVVQFRNALRSTSYAVLDSGYKYQYDKYNDVYRYVPLNGDIAGLTVRTDTTNDPWWSPAGATRGLIKNIIKLSYNPSKADRDVLYKNGVNPVVTFPGQGTMLYGDKTLLSKASAFDRINVRRLFIVLEKTIANAAKSTLFEFNDEFTRAQFKNLVEPFLREVQGRRGVYDFKVICDETNNTDEVIDTNRFVGDIYIKPAKSINFIQLNFVAVRTGVEFSEITGSL